MSLLHANDIFYGHILCNGRIKLINKRLNKNYTSLLHCFQIKIFRLILNDIPRKFQFVNNLYTRILMHLLKKAKI